MKVKTSELIGPQLDWAAAKCEGLVNTYPTLSTELARQELRELLLFAAIQGKYAPSTDWAQGGPIIEREGISVSLRYYPDIWDAVIKPEFYSTGIPNSGVKKETIMTGPTPLVAVMRCYVTSKLGDEVEVPDELAKD